MFSLKLAPTSDLLLAVALLLVPPAAVAQTAPTADSRPLPTPAQSSSAPVLPLNPALPTLFIVGDSTARNQADLGWGDHLAPYFDTTRINLANRAYAGRSTRSFINEGRWEKVLAEMKAGDYVLIQLGHNDGGELDGPKPRGSIKSLGDESKDITLLDGTKETVHTYGWYIRKYINDTRAKHATPILLTLTIRNIWTKDADGKAHIERDMGFDGLIRQLASDQQVLLVDMANYEADYLESIGPEKSALLFPIDHTHTSAEGAEMNARIVTRALRSTLSPLVSYLAPGQKN